MIRGRIQRIAFAALVLGYTVRSMGQELNCEVTVNAESIPSSQRDYVRNFKADLERYLNNNRYTGEDYEGEKIQCSMNIIFKAVVGDNQYQAQAFIGSVRPVYYGNDPTTKISPILRIFDDKWTFVYMPNQRMLQDDFSFDPLTDFLDFYAYLIIGFDLETYKELDGSKYFQKALNICNLGSASAFASDWTLSSSSYSRFGIVSELSDAKYNGIRLAFFSYHFEGIDLLTTDRARGLDNMLKALESIKDIRQRQNPTSVLVKQFFDAKHQEIADAFGAYGDRSIYDKLSTLDPEHRQVYQDFKARP